jgi:hypothetical protein
LYVPVGAFTPRPMPMLPFRCERVFSTQYRAAALMSPMPRVSCCARGPGVGPVGVGIDHDAERNGIPTVNPSRSDFW